MLTEFKVGNIKEIIRKKAILSDNTKHKTNGYNYEK